MVSLQEKRKSMIETRKRMLHDSVASPQHDLPAALSFRVKREQIVKDSCKVLWERRVEELLAPAMKVCFEGEPGIDQGGLMREWFDEMSKALNEDASSSAGVLLTTLPDSSLMPRPQAAGEQEDQLRFRQHIAIGRFLALAVF